MSFMFDQFCYGGWCWTPLGAVFCFGWALGGLVILYFMYLAIATKQQGGLK